MLGSVLLTTTLAVVVAEPEYPSVALIVQLRVSPGEINVALSCVVSEVVPIDQLRLVLVVSPSSSLTLAVQLASELVYIGLGLMVAALMVGLRLTTIVLRLSLATAPWLS